MRLSIVAMGTRMPGWVEEGVREYARRMPRELQLDWREIPLARRGGEVDAQRLCEREGDRLLRAVPEGDTVIALDVAGKALSTVQLAGELRAWQMSGDNYSLLIGGPEGLSAPCLARARWSWSLSALTLPHPLVRVLLAEQLYRAWTINVNHPYHRA
ncbi:MAG: 23S rRNA (pseudouridine(1915)-N(3))-methyltransferase RlmH [Halioglobus sp.]|nr:23S rRNA (pseudouridine(1915)-N(3))-methyltransferase RlmH [Halioglobus sp.]